MNAISSQRHWWCRLCTIVVTLAIAAPAFAALNIEGLHDQPFADFDVRADTPIAPSQAQLGAVAGMGATASWTEFGTPRSLIRQGDFLATGLDADPEVAARDWLRANAALFRLSAVDVDALELYHVGKFAHSDARAIKFRQIYNGLASQGGGIVTIGVLDGKIAIATSSIVGIPSGSPIEDISTTAAQALAIAAANVNFDVSAGFGAATADNAWTTHLVSGLTGVQRARPMAFVTPNGVRPVWETWLIDNSGGGTRAYMHLVDASSGATQGQILFRQNKVFQSYDGGAEATAVKPDHTRAPVVNNFNGTYTGPMCGPSATTYHGPYSSNGSEGYVSAEVAASDLNAANDIVIDVYIDRGAGIEFLAQFDFLTSPENGTISPVEAADYYVQICAFEGADPIPPGAYAGTFTFNDTAAGIGNDPRWKHFESNPNIDLSNTDIRKLGCWLDASCDFTIANNAARAPWDHDHNIQGPTNTMKGNAAFTAEAWLSPLTPAEGYAPTSPTRNYDYPWTNAWFASGCSPSNFVPGVGNDIDAAVVNMFVDHNRVHDWAYYLGWTEQNSNHQYRNLGNTDQTRENDPIFGNVQAGAIDGAYPAYLGRDNANWVPLPDGAPGITNQYLWQALRGTIYTPCADGNYDMGIVGHEVGHGIQHRMTGGPATGLGGDQGGAMGEAWGDLTGMEIQNEFGSVPVQSESPFAIGVYVLGSPERGIRNYNMSDSPLNYSNYLYDPFGSTSPHANGEIWTATQFQLRQAFIAQHDGTDPASDGVKQRQCAEGKFAPGDCPGNRRYIQIMHDGFLLQPAAPSMLDARDAQMAADLLRFAEDAGWGDHQNVMWSVYAQRGMGDDASATSSNDTNPTAGFSLPAGHPDANAVIDITVLAKDESDAPITGVDIFIGDYEARSNPVATTDGNGVGSATLAPGTYNLLARANGYGHMRFSLTLSSGQTGPITVKMPTNFASSTKGATASGDGTNLGNLLDDSEASHWEFSGTDLVGTTQAGDPQEQIVEINLNGAKSVSRVQVSALPASGGNRFENLRQFAVDACNVGLTSDCTSPADFARVFTSDIDAFNGQPIRPLAPNHIIRSFELPQTILASHLRFVALENQCTGSSEFTADTWATGAAPPDNVQDCRDDLTGTFPMALPSRNDVVRASAFQVFASVGDVITVLDSDLDGILDDVDNCVNTPNADQLDDDSDGLGNVCDNCILVANANQCDTNGDGYGNVCDGDLNNNNVVNFVDLGMLKSAFLSSPADSNWNPDADLSCDGVVVNFVDLGILKGQFLGTPGPSGIAP